MNPGSGFGSEVGPNTKFKRNSPVLFGKPSPNSVTANESERSDLSGDHSHRESLTPTSMKKFMHFSPLPATGVSVRGDSSRAQSPIYTKKLPSEASQVIANNGPTLSTVIPSKLQGPKRTRSPTLGNVDTLFTRTPASDQDLEREMKAKAKRMARFHAELSQPEDDSPEFLRNFTGSRNSLSPARAVKTPPSTSKMSDAFSDGALVTDGLDVFAPIQGVCPDMCPESERGERERKGDLDQYERLDGERNQTSVYLAVKKYTRTAERDAKLIRPMPVLQKTVDYLLNLLNHPYDHQLLGLYNFLWDRMRAVRMDLRMQHIFNRDAIKMLEQMIRLHIVAMHELAEYPKGEGFSEGFDAHLNIEQMNKTSVELFQMYADHRKQGIIISSEKEFRGYYALLKLDKHPGYRVEPSELSLNLANISPDIRNSPDIVFAREAARASRTGNYIAFFRLARKATYLQACLMHAHFSKVRTQAFASLYSSLQNNQGIPIERVVKWLAIEGEDVNSLIDYYGFSIKKFEEPYMVKGGPFLNGDVDYPTKSSQLVKMKRSKTMVEDICPNQPVIVSDNQLQSSVVDDIGIQEIKVHVPEVVVDIVEDNKAGLVFADLGSSEIMEPQTTPAEQLLLSSSPESAREIETDDDDYDIQMEKYDDTIPLEPLKSFELPLSVDAGPFLTPSQDITLYEAPAPRTTGVPIQTMVEAQPESNLLIKDYLNEPVEESSAREAYVAWLRRLVRRWKKNASRKREMSVRRLSLAYAALNSLSLGPPLRQTELKAEEGRRLTGNLDIDSAARNRYINYERSWTRLNVSEAIAPVLSTRSPQAKCLVWKLAICLQADYGREDEDELLFSSWLLWKLMGSHGGEEDDELLLSSPALSIWRMIENSGKVKNTSGYCCYSVVREVGFKNNSQLNIEDDPSAISGLSAIIFLASEAIPWASQRDRLHKILDFIPSGSSLPLVILMSFSTINPEPDKSSVIDSLQLEAHQIRAAISNICVFLFGENHRKGCFFGSDDHLHDCLQWLAENSPLQPSLLAIKPRDLITGALGPQVTALENSFLSPNDCITLFNKACDDAIEKIRSAAAANKYGWPAPELDSFTANWLPKSGWSSREKIEVLMSAIKRWKLPDFPDDWLQLSRQGFEVLSDLARQKAALEFCLLGYLVNSIGLDSEGLASLEARVMVQKGASLERQGHRHFIVPDWMTIFRRIYNWRLMSLSSPGNISVAFVLMDTRVPSVDLPVRLVQPSCSRRVLLEEMEFETDDKDVPEPTVSIARDATNGDAISQAALFCMGCNQKEVFGMIDGEPIERVADRLTALLEKCNSLQDSIGQKLAIYF